MNIEYSAGGIILNQKRILLVYQKNTQTWAFPKGHLVGNENEIEAAKREIWEETSIINLKLVRKLGSYTRPTKKSENITKHITMYLFTTEDNFVFPKKQDVERCVWVHPKEVSEKLWYPGDKEFFLKIKNQLLL